MAIVDSAMTREVMHDLAKRPVDISALQVHVTHGIVYLRGRLEKQRGYYGDVDLREELNVIHKVLRQKSGIREVICEVEIGGLTLAERVDPHRKRSS